MKKISEKDKEFLSEILYSLFRSQTFSDRPEEIPVCPFCSNFSDPNHQSHNDLAYHIMDEHPNELLTYSEIIENVLNNPLHNIHFGEGYYKRVMGGEEYYNRMGKDEDVTLICSFCVDHFTNKIELNKHYREEHKEKLKRAKELLKRYSE